MKIEVIENFGGRETNEQRIIPGVYDRNDPRLHGESVIQFLLDTRKARIIQDVTTPDVPTPDTELSRDALMLALEAAGIEYSKYWTTDKLHEALHNA